MPLVTMSPVTTAMSGLARRQSADVQIGQMRDADAVEPGIEPVDANGPLDDADPPAPDENSVAADEEPRKVTPHVRRHGSMHGRAADEGHRRRDERCQRGGDERPKRRAPMDEIRNVDEANHELVSMAVRHAGASAADK
jgi:hypothetical protein